MRAVVRVIAACSALAALPSCASFFDIHDPQTLILTREQVPDLLKSIRCELTTFYEANRQRTTLYKFYAKRDRDFAIDNYPYFPLAEDLLGGVYLDLKVMDSGGLPGPSTLLSNKISDFPLHSQTLQVVPTLSSQNTYQMIRSFVIPQNHTIAAVAISKEDYDQDNIPEVDSFQCYKAIPKSHHARHGKPLRDWDGLAAGQYPKVEQFRRMWVNTRLPLAAWVQENGTDTWTNFAAKRKSAEIKENMFPAQLSYGFTLQVTGGIDARFSLISTRWNPLAVNASASIQQTSVLQFVVNGPDAGLAVGAKIGTAATKLSTTPVPESVGPAAPSCLAPQGSQGCLLAPLPLPLPMQQ